MHQGLWRVSAAFHTEPLFSQAESAEFETLRSFFIICMHNLPLLSQQKGYKRMINTETATKVINPFQRWDTYCFLMAHALTLPPFPSVL